MLENMHRNSIKSLVKYNSGNQSIHPPSNLLSNKPDLYIKPPNFSNIKSQNSLSFRGAGPSPALVNVLNYFAEKSQNPNFCNLFCIGSGVFSKPLIYLNDKKMPKDDRNYVTAQFFVGTGIGLFFQYSIIKPIEKASESFIKYLYNIPKNLKISDNIPQKTNIATQNILKNISNTSPVAIGGVKIARYAATTAISIAFGLYIGLILDRVLDKVSKKLTGKPFDKRPKKPLTPKEKAEDKKKEDLYFKKIGLPCAALLGLEIGSKLLFKKPVVSGGLKKLIGSLKPVWDPMIVKMRNSQKLANYFAKQANLSDHDWLIKGILINMVVGPLGQITNMRLSMVLRSFFLESTGLFLTLGGKKVVNRLIGKGQNGVTNGPIVKLLKLNPKNGKLITGLDSLLSELIVTFFMLNVAREILSVPLLHKATDIMEKNPTIRKFMLKYDKETIAKEQQKQWEAEQAAKKTKSNKKENTPSSKLNSGKV
jgi:hypothetical protein